MTLQFVDVQLLLYLRVANSIDSVVIFAAQKKQHLGQGHRHWGDWGGQSNNCRRDVAWDGETLSTPHFYTWQRPLLSAYAALCLSGRYNEI